MTQPGQFGPQSGQGQEPQPQPQPGQWQSGPPPMPYSAAGISEGYGVRLSFVLPPGTELASVGRRIGGYFLEFLLALVTLVIGYIIWSLVVWARGQTPGKQVLGEYCYRPSVGRPANWGFMLLRGLGQALVSAIPFGFIVSSIMMIVSDEHKSIHDHIAGTVVLHRTS
jgi:uncharacterized RDD family membrane protein YckC